eukprot:2850519-Heterocapsa_arctica.AAC.1
MGRLSKGGVRVMVKHPGNCRQVFPSTDSPHHKKGGGSTPSRKGEGEPASTCSPSKDTARGRLVMIDSMRNWTRKRSGP